LVWTGPAQQIAKPILSRAVDDSGNLESRQRTISNGRRAQSLAD